MTEDFLKELNQTFEQCTPLVRDTTLDDWVLSKYRVGLFLREPTFCDATYKIGGLIAPHRFLLISSNAKCLDAVAPNPWGLCLWERGRAFKIIDRCSASGFTQFTLLEIPDRFLEWFSNDELNVLEQSFVAQARQTFGECTRMPPLPELDTQAWRERLTLPIGINDGGEYFPLFPDEMLTDDGTQRTAAVMHHQGRIHLVFGDYVAAHHDLYKAFESSRRSTDHETSGSILLSLADLQMMLSDFTKAETTLFSAFEAFKKIPHAENRDIVAATHVRLGHLYQRTGADMEAEQNYLHALKIRRRTAKDERALIPLLSSLGALHERKKQWMEAHKYLDEALTISQTTAGECHDSVLLNNLGRLAQGEGDFKTALHYLQLALNCEQQASHRHYEHETALIYNIGECLAAMGETQRAFESFRSGLSRDQDALLRVALVASDRQRQAFIVSRQFRIHQCLSLILTSLAQSSEAREFAAQLIFERKGLALDFNVIHKELLLHGANEEDRASLRRLWELRSNANLRTVSGQASNDEERTALQQDLQQYEQLESESATRLPSAEFERRLRSYTWRDVAERLTADSVLVEYFQLQRWSFERPAASSAHERTYLAIALTQTSESPQIVDLGDAVEIDRQISRLRSATTGQLEPEPSDRRRSGGQSTRSLSAYPSEHNDVAASARRLEALLLEPIGNTLCQKKRIIVAPDGNLCRLPFEVLVDSAGSELIDRFDLRYATGAYDLLRRATRPTSKPNRPVVIAAPDFNAVKAGYPHAVGEAADVPFAPLPGAREEGHAVADALGVEAITGTHAVESMVKNVHSPSVLHFATHGFVLEYSSKYLSPEQITEGMVITSDSPIIAVRDGTPPQRQEGCEEGFESYIAVSPAKMLPDKQVRQFSRLSGQGIENPMLRCGLALAGANTWLGGGSPPEEDGILTAEELSALDLANTQLVVLSACETGLGDVLGGEGVFGLRRSFVLSGAASLVISLWRVPDIQTKELMAEFYARLLHGESTAAALRHSKLVLRGRYPHPYYWAAFICQGDARPLENSL